MWAIIMTKLPRQIPLSIPLSFSPSPFLSLLVLLQKWDHAYCFAPCFKKPILGIFSCLFIWFLPFHHFNGCIAFHFPSASWLSPQFSAYSNSLSPLCILQWKWKLLMVSFKLLSLTPHHEHLYLSCFPSSICDSCLFSQMIHASSLKSALFTGSLSLFLVLFSESSI